MEQLKKTPCASQWEKIGIKQHHGIYLPLFSLHGETSVGIGEYPDLIPLIHWCQEIGFDIIQLLPLNDTGHQSTSPYSAISPFALNPIHLGLAQLPYLADFPHLKGQIPELHTLCATQKVDYPAVYEVKNVFLRDYAKHAAHLMTHTHAYKRFLEENNWLESYALYKALKEHFQDVEWEEWPEKEKNPTEAYLKELFKTFSEEIHYHIFLQYLCFQQMEEVKEEADKAGVFLKGDIPILINRDSADIWKHRSLFDCNYSAGSPPDPIFIEGQNWNFPIYNWEAHEKNGYQWWKDRLNVASKLFHIYRLDHIIGFYRIYAIPRGKSPKEGVFLPEDKTLWIPQGNKILNILLKNCPDMLPIGENLPPEDANVLPELEKLGICEMLIMRWYRNADGSYINKEKYPILSMTQVSTHDHDTLLMWWENFREDSKAWAKSHGWPYTYELSKEHLYDILYESHHTASLFHVNLLNEYLALFPELTWPDPHDERINYPGTISTKNWTYRFRPTLQEIISHPQLKKTMKNLIDKKN